MNKRLVAKIIKKKFNHFLKSIKDEKVKELVKQNSIITGGSIASLLLGEDVNDYDIYFTNKETVKAVMEYYIEEFQKNTPNLSKKVKFYVQEEVKGTGIGQDGRIKLVIKSVGVATEGQDNENYEYFETVDEEKGMDFVDNAFDSVGEETQFEEGSPVVDPVERLVEVDETYVVDRKKKGAQYRPLVMTSNAITLADEIQLIIRFYGNAEEIHKNYDFTHCTNYWLSSTGELVLQKDALESILTKQLYYQGSLYPLASIIRTRKFIKRGWHINAGQYLKMCFQISKMNLTDPVVLEDQLMGVDVAYFTQVLKWLKQDREEYEAMEDKVPYLVSLIDKIF